MCNNIYKNYFREKDICLRRSHAKKENETGVRAKLPPKFTSVYFPLRNTPFEEAKLALSRGGVITIFQKYITLFL